MNNTPWIEKYRPIKLDDIITNDNIKKKIAKIINTLEMDNLLLPGVPGIGKTTSIKCIARALYGKYIDNAVLELNASDDRGIKIVQEKIINFCKTSLDLNEKSNYDLNKNNRKYANFKLIFLDEADNMTDKAQKLINSLMDKYSKTVRFAFTCNNSSDIIEGIQSRCNIIRFSKLSNEQIIERLLFICNTEKIKYDNLENCKKCLNVIANISDGDLRGAINVLQLVYRSHDNLTIDNIFNVCSKPQPEILKNITTYCINKELKSAINEINTLKKNGYCESDIIIGLIYFIKSDNTINDSIKIKLLNIFSYYAYIISKGLSTNLQLNACICKIISL